ncbi:antA/AntB antirepressor family protein [Mailhella sp.]
MSLSLSVVSASIGNVQQLTVDARTLHRTLGVKCDFSSWIKRRIEKYGFKENEDFEVFIKSEENPIGGRSSKEYTLSLDMAKELAMVENNERGRLVRRYFIECERRLQEARPARKPRAKTLPQPVTPPLPNVFEDAPISMEDLSEVLGTLVYRMEKTCRNFTSPEYEAGMNRFHKAAGNEARLDCMISATLVGPKYATLEMLKAASRLADNARKTHLLVCRAGK